MDGQARAAVGAIRAALTVAIPCSMLTLVATTSITLAQAESADGFVYEPVEPRVHRLITDGAGHFPSALEVQEARDIDRVVVDDEGRVLVWSTPHGGDNDIAGGEQVWTLGEPGYLQLPGERDWDKGAMSAQRAADGASWSIAADGRGGVLRQDGPVSERYLAGNADVNSLAITPDGRVWVAVGHPDGEAGGIYVISPAETWPTVNGWPGTEEVPAGLYSWRPGSKGWMHKVPNDYTDTNPNSVELTFVAGTVDKPAGQLLSHLVARTWWDENRFDAPTRKSQVRTQVWLLDVEDTRIAILLDSYPETDPALVAEAEAVIESIRVSDADDAPGPRLIFELMEGWDSG